ncbi:MAG TPA: hypothetical protein VJR89_29905 [Polyangiales bacterium]|nr:hypothetical protein [Polyangiales bacterium]
MERPGGISDGEVLRGVAAERALLELQARERHIFNSNILATKLAVVLKDRIALQQDP